MAVEVEVDEREFRAAGPFQRRKLREYAQRLVNEPFLGDRIPNARIPRPFRRFPNLFRLELPQGWRAVYTVLGSTSIGLRVRILWIGDHKRYERLFGY